MSENSEPARELWIALAQPESLEKVEEAYAQIETAGQTGQISTEEVGNLRAQAFRAMKKLAGDDPILARKPILQLILPLCLASPLDSSERLAASDYREILGKWLESAEESGLSAVREEVIQKLLDALKTQDAERACWSLNSIGFRTPGIVAALWDVAERETGEAGDVAMGTIASLGIGFTERSRLLTVLHERCLRRHTNSLIWAVGHLGDPTSLDVIDSAWFGDVSASWWKNDSFLLIGVLSRIADANPDDARVQDRVWAIISRLHQDDPETMDSRLLLGSNLAPSCDTPRVVPDFLAMLESRRGGGERDQHGRYLIYLRVRECFRPRQLEGWRTQIPESVISILLADVTRDTKTSGVYRTLTMDLKWLAWDILLSLGRSDMLSSHMFELAIATETGAHVRCRIIEWLACFRYTNIPPTVARWVTDQRRIGRDDAADDLTFRTASTRLLQSAASSEAFDLLLRTGYSIDGSALLSSLEALAEVAHVLATHDDPSIAERLVEVVAVGAERNQRASAAQALIELATSGLIPEKLIGPIWKAARSSGRDDPELSRIVDVLGHLPRMLMPEGYEEQLILWARGTGQLAQRAVEALARQSILAERPELLPDLVGLTIKDGCWGLVEGSRVPDSHGFAIALLYEDRPSEFESALTQYIRDKDWFVTAQVFDLLDHSYDQKGAMPKALVTALVFRIRSNQKPYSAEPETFEILGRWSGSTLAGESWEEKWASWLPESRVAIADALGRLDGLSDEVAGQALAKILLLTGDGTYAVRRSAYRALARLSPQSLQSYIAASAQSPSTNLRRRGAEACGWIDSVEEFKAMYARFASDPEEAVRESAQRADTERKMRGYADAHLKSVLAIEEGTDSELLATWPYGRALAQTGDDEVPRVIREHATSRVFNGHVAYWLERINEGIKKSWRAITEKWPEPWYTWDGAIVKGTGYLVTDGNKLPVDYCIVKEPSKLPTGVYSWHGVAWTTETRISLAHMAFGPVDRQEELILSDGSCGQILVTSRSFERIIFSGNGHYPRVPE
jgi:hypothetical protein